MLASKFRVLEIPIHCNVERIDNIVQALCVLHNFIHIHEGTFSEPAMEQDTTNYLNGNQPNQSQRNNQRQTNNAINLRNRLSNFFLKPGQILPWQEKYTV